MPTFIGLVLATLFILGIAALIGGDPEAKTVKGNSSQRFADDEFTDEDNALNDETERNN